MHLHLWQRQRHPLFNPVHVHRPPWYPQAEDDEGQTPLGAAAAHGQLREGLAALAKGEKSLDDFMIEDV